MYRIFFLSFFCSVAAYAQSDWAKQYDQAKKYVDQARYDAALEILTPLIKAQKGNDYVLHSQYLYAYAALQQNNLLSSRDMLLQLKQQHADWQEIEKVNWLLATVYMKLDEYRKAVNSVRSVSAASPYLNDWKKEYYPAVKPLDTLMAIQKSAPYDLELAEELYARLSRSVNLSQVQKSRMLILEKEYGFSQSVVEQKQMVSLMKDRYHIALLLPFQVKEVDVTANSRSNQYLYDMYAGMKMALDSLNKDVSKAPIEIHAYDTEKDVNKVKEVVTSKEWQAIDLVIGPLFPEQYTYIKELPEVQGKVLLNPMAGHAKYADKPGTYLYKASVEATVASMVNYASANFTIRKNVHKDPGVLPKKEVVVLYGKEVKDSVMAHMYKDSIVKKGFVIKKFLKVDVNYMGALRSFVSDSVGLIKISHIVTLSSDPVFAANIISLMEITQQYIPMYAYSDWLNNTQLSYSQMEKRGVHFIDPDYVRINTNEYKRFYKAYIAKYNVFPSVYAMQGYEMLTIVGRALREGGTDISVYLNKQGYFSLGILGGYDFSNANYNKFVPLVVFKDMKLNIVNEVQ